MLERCIVGLRLVISSGGHGHLEQPPSAMSWQEPAVQQYISQESCLCISVAACGYGRDWHKSWMFASTFRALGALACQCSHPYGSHQQIAGALSSSGHYLSRDTAEYPEQLAASFARLVCPLLTTNSLDLDLSQAVQFLPIKLLLLVKMVVALHRKRIGAPAIPLMIVFGWCLSAIISSPLFPATLLWLQETAVIGLSAAVIAIICLLTGLPISWKKCEIGATIVWIGWSFNLRAGFVAIPTAKREKLLTLLQKLHSSTHCSKKSLERFLGLALWVTQLWPEMRIWLHYLYRDLHSIPASQFSVDPGNWEEILNSVSEDLIFFRKPRFTAIPLDGHLVQVTYTVRQYWS
eukprot:s223_g7.t1